MAWNIVVWEKSSAGLFPVCDCPAVAGVRPVGGIDAAHGVGSEFIKINFKRVIPELQQECP